MLCLLKCKRFWVILLIPLSSLITLLGRTYPHVVEKIYSTGIYPAMTSLFGRISNIFPFSISEILIVCGVPVVILYFILQIKRIIAKKNERKDIIVRLSANIAMLSGAIVFVFVVTSGLNYHRTEFIGHTGLTVYPTSANELALLCSELINTTNQLREHLPEDENGYMTSSFENYYEAAVVAQQAYALLGEEYPVLSGYTPRPKPVFLSRGMSYIDLVGIYTGYTFEANINTDIPAYSIPSGMMHELAHYKGFMREDEANYIAWKGCLLSGNPDFAYSGSMLALIHTSNALYNADSDLYWHTIEDLSPKVRMDLASNSEYWSQFTGPAAVVSAVVNDTYLKTNRQSDGIRSYGRMVDLLLADFFSTYEEDQVII